jgi:hypothetical protein
MEVVAEPHVGRRGLRRDRAQRRVRLGRGHDRRPAVVADAEHADAAVVVRHVLHEPVDRVVGIGAFVDLQACIGRAQRTLHHERALALVPSAYVLEHEHVAVFGEASFM